MLIVFVIMLLAAAIVWTILPRFGQSPKGERLLRIQKSPHYIDGQFQNSEPTPLIDPNASYFDVFKEMLRRRKIKEPHEPLPSVMTDLKSLPLTDDALIWMGHSSYYLQVSGKRFLVDPIFSGHASPFSFLIKAFAGSDIYTPEDMPDIDYLIITHDHWDHLDYQTIMALKPRIKQVYCSLGVGAHLAHWGFTDHQIVEGDWYDSFALEGDMTLHITPSRHFSGRSIKRNQTLWASFVLLTPNLRLFIGGDGGYGNHMSEIGRQFGPFDLAILENGQYDKKWRHIHMMPDEQMQALSDLRAKAVLPVHSSKFTLANHDWDEPLSKIITHQNEVRILTPMIGECVRLHDATQVFTPWWQSAQ